MKFAHLAAAAAILASAAAGAAPALEFRSVGLAPAIMYDVPSVKGRKVFIAPRGMPVEIVLTYGDWVKVRDPGGDLSWLEAKALVQKRHVIVAAPLARVRTASEDTAPIAFTADKGVLLELLDPAVAGWVRVRHRDGLSGFVKASEVWGE